MNHMPSRILYRLNISAHCREYRVPLWQCPDFLFPLMGVIIITAMLVSYFIASRYLEDPFLIVSLMSVLTIVLMVFGFLINKTFETLAESNRIKSEFVRIASHQLRTPVTAIGWAVDLLKSERVGDSTIKKQITIIAESHEQMTKLITNLLEVNRIEEERFSLVFLPVSLREVTAELVQRLTPLAAASNVTLHWTPPQNPFVISGDPDRTRLAIRNLLENAIQYIGRKGEVWISLSQNGTWAQWEIKDTGVGIPRYQQRNIFSKFFRSDNSLRHQTRGNGLGLFLTKAIVTATGGEIGFVSREGKGSTFWFRVPLAAA